MNSLELKIPPVVVAALTIGSMWIVAKNTPGSDMAFGDQLSGLLLATGVAVMLWSTVSFSRAKTTVDPTKPHAASSLLTSGLFGISRNPIYVGMFLFILGCGFRMGNVFSLALAAGFVFYMNRFQIEPEEDALEKLFPEEYSEYRKRVRRWL